jgi:hypothetical protein
MSACSPTPLSLRVLLVFLGCIGQLALASEGFGAPSLDTDRTGTSKSPRIVNPSFELNTFTLWPGYTSDNGGVVTGWEGLLPGNSGLNPISDGQSPFADNGAIPDGTRVAFLQSNPSLSRGSTLATRMTGLVPGSIYSGQFRANARSNNSVRIQVAVSGEPIETSLNGGAPALSQVISPVGGSNPYHRVSFLFTAAAADQALEIINVEDGDNTVLLDDFQLKDGDRLFADRFFLLTDLLGFENLDDQLLAPGVVNIDGDFVIEVLFGESWQIRADPAKFLVTGVFAPDIDDVLSIRRVDGGQFRFYSLEYRQSGFNVSDTVELLGLNAGQAVFFSAPDRRSGSGMADAPVRV